MKTSPPALLPPEIHARLSLIAAKERRTALAGCIARIAGAFLLLALVAMFTDRAFRFFHPAWRWLATLTVVSTTAAVAWHWRRLVKWKSSPLAAALAAEKTVPGVEERWSTLASLSNRSLPDSMRGAESLLSRVRDEASEFKATAPVRARESRSGLVKGLLWLAAGAGATGLWYLSDPGAAGIRWQRLMAPWSDASLTRVSAFPQPVPVVVPRHEAWELQAVVSGRPVPFVDLIVRDATGMESPVRLAAGPDSGLFSHILRDPREPFSFRFRAGDGQTPWHKVTVADRPVIASAAVTVTPPAYTGQKPEQHEGIPPSIRVLEGSTLTVSLATGGSGQDVSLVLRAGMAETEQRVPMARGVDGHYRWSATPAESFRFHPLLRNAEGLTNKTPPVCTVEVIPDRPPVVTLAENTAAKALTPEDTVEVAFTATDDVGIQRMEIVVKLEKKGQAAKEVIVPVDMKGEKGARSVEKRVALDLSKLPLEPGVKISYAVRAADGKGAEAEAAANKEGKQGEENNLAAKPGDKEGEGDGKGKAEPPNAMGTRRLDVGQSSCSCDKNLEIEDYTGDSPTYREKVTIPVLPVLEKITVAVKAAHASTVATRNGLAAQTRLDEARLTKVSHALAQLKIAATECESLATKTKDTPYALIGLQLRDLRASKLAPAETELTASKEQADPGPPLILAEVHLQAALDWLEKLTKQAAAIKRTEAAEELAQKVKKMHRIFLEDSMKLLEKAEGGGGPGAPELGVLEVNEEYARLLKERMEKMKELMKEFAKLLESDPDLLTRFLAQKAKGSMAMQAQLQALLTDQQNLNIRTVSLSEAATPAARSNALVGEKAECLAKYQTLVHEAARIHASASVRFPKGLRKDEGAGANLLKALRATTVALQTNPPAAMQEIDRAMEALNQLSVLPGGANYAHIRKNELIRLKLSAGLLENVLEAAAAGKTGRVAELHQRDLTRRTREFTEKVEGGMMGIAAAWPTAEKAAAAVKTSLFQGVLPHQRAASGFLKGETWGSAKSSQQDAEKGLIAAAAAWRAMIERLAEEMRKNPPPPPEAPNTDMPDLDALTKMMEMENEEIDDYGLPQWKINLQIVSDWEQQGKGGSGGAMPAPAPAGDLRAAQERERTLEREAAKAQEAANAQAKALTGKPLTSETKRDGNAAGGENEANTAASRRQDWNRLPSELNKNLRQQNDHPPPEEYRHAVEVYFRRIGVEPPLEKRSP